MMPRKSVTLSLLLVAGACFAQPQAKQFLPTDDWTYQLIDYWITNSTLTPGHVLNQPYALADITTGLAGKRGWQGLVRRYYRKHFARMGMATVSFYGRENVSLVSGTTGPGSKALRSPPIDDVILFDQRTKNHYNVTGKFHLMLPHFTLVNRTVVNSEYLDDPLYAGDSSEWLYGRVHDAYANVSAGAFDIFAGRMARNWGGLRQPGLILSDNAYTFDHLYLSYTRKKFKYSFMVTRLEDLLAQDDTLPDSLIDARKFLSAQRLNFSFSPNFQIALSQIAVYGGAGRDFELAFLSPANFFYLSQRNDGLQMNGIWALDLFYKPRPRWNLLLQLLIDDFIINNDPGVDDRGRYPDRLGVTLEVANADVFAPGLQVKATYTRMGNRTYQSRRTWENFHYRGKSLGFPYSSVERLGLALNYFALFPALLQFESSYQRRGDVRPTDLFPLRKEAFPIGTVETEWQASLKLRYFLTESAQLSFSMGYDAFDNFNNIKGATKGSFVIVFGAHISHSFFMNLQ